MCTLPPRNIEDHDIPAEVDEQLSRIPQRWIEQHLDKRKGNQILRSCH